MTVLGIESSCDECSAALVINGKKVISNVILTQIEDHKIYNGVVPELASRLHTEMISGVVDKAITEAGMEFKDIDAIAVTNRPGLSGSLLVGLSFAKGLSAVLGIPFIGIDHIRAHLYAPHLDSDITYPYLGLLVSGGHTIICRVNGFDDVSVLGTTVDDAIGEAFDKVAKHYNLGYPGGAVIDDLAKKGNDRAFHFPSPKLKQMYRKYDVSYSGLKTAVINQTEKFWNGESEKNATNLAASFQRRAVAILMDKVHAALEDTGLTRIAAGGGVAANSLLRKSIMELEQSGSIKTYLPSMEYCTDNGAMIAGVGYHYLKEGRQSGYDESVSARIAAFKSAYWNKKKRM